MPSLPISMVIFLIIGMPMPIIGFMPIIGIIIVMPMPIPIMFIIGFMTIMFIMGFMPIMPIMGFMPIIGIMCCCIIGIWFIGIAFIMMRASFGPPGMAQANLCGAGLSVRVDGQNARSGGYSPRNVGVQG